MKTHIKIAALLVAASALLSSCELLVSSPIHYPSNHHHSAYYGSGYYGGRPLRNNKVYKGLFEVPADGGTFEFDCADDQFYISRIYDSTMPLPRKTSNCRHSPTTNDLWPVYDLTYTGSFYTITCNRDEHNWIIKIDPLISIPGQINDRDILVYMWDGADDYNFIFRFEQSDNEDSSGYTE